MAQRERSILGLFSSSGAGATRGERAARACPAPWAFVLVLAIGLAACGGDDDAADGDNGDGDTPGVDGGVIGDPNCAAPDFVGMGSGCEDPPCLEAPEYGFQVRSVGTMIDSLEDVEYCEIVQLPGDPSETYYVTGFDSAMTLGSHHLIVTAIEPGSSTESNATVGDRVECITADTAGWGDDLYEVTGQQLPYHADSFPEGVGRVYHGGQKLIFDYHYLNLQDEPIQARAAVNFYAAEESCVEKIARNAGFYNFNIGINDGETGSFTKECTYSQDVMVHKLSRHTHKWGTDFPVEFYGGERDSDDIYTSPSYEDPDYTFDEPVLVKAGEGFRWTCNYNNTSGHYLMFGTEATDEMCILFSTIYAAEGRDLQSQQGCGGF